ncbi:L-proline glycine betaine binding ABC transporter protein ProX [Desulfosporosinus sp. I2]|uniref:glycine betaine ABC transporter substrate-binding protein n=1 Tax=Desulfosporosinus sp. I2 TaxID=1617025 RepID=UPI0005ED5DD3|nr:glycine betaine ABC transporter substrate-binding protein [Desulfosporosinus sp. I2]KJR49410.1 L-proline glycine betaine binding ABC transporter protein ProX [Desulfosporosinus sp. I2]
MKKTKMYGVLAVVLLLVLSLVGCSANDKVGAGDTIKIGGKNFTEQDILVYLMAGVVEAKTDLKVEPKPWLGGTMVASKALDAGDIDIYAEYTGTALTVQLEQEVITDPDEAYAKVSKMYKETKDITWLKPFGFNNTYTLTMRKAEAEKLGVKTFSDLVKHAPDLVMASEPEFLERDDGYKGIQKLYGIQFKDVKAMDAGLMYSAVKDGKADVCPAYATDGRIVAFDLQVLKDDKQFFPPYYAAPIVRNDTLTKHPELADALNSLSGKLDDSVMQQLNAKVDLDKKAAKDVANEWLKAQGLI